MHRSAPRPHHRRVRSFLASTAVLAATLAVGACGTPAADLAAPATAGAPASSASSAPLPGGSTAAGALVLESGWAKAASGMTAVFGTLLNHSTKPVTIVGGSSGAARTVEVHTMVKQPDGSMKMTKMKDGLTIAAQGSAVLAPGADHIMLIGLKAPLTNGEQVTIAMATAAGDSFEWTVPVRSFAGAEETYVPEDH